MRPKSPSRDDLVAPFVSKRLTHFSRAATCLCFLAQSISGLLIYEIIDDWKLDITLTKTLQNIVSFDIDILDNEIKDLFPENVNEEIFHEKAPWNNVDNIELELEYSEL